MGAAHVTPNLLSNETFFLVVTAVYFALVDYLMIRV